MPGPNRSGRSDPGAVPERTTSRSESGNGSGSRMTVLTTLNIPVTAPIASASVPTAVTRKPGVRSSARHA